MPQSFYMGPTRQTLSGMREGGLARRRGQLAMGAKMGDPRDLERLYMLDPQQAQMVEKQRAEQAQMDSQNRMAFRQAQLRELKDFQSATQGHLKNMSDLTKEGREQYWRLNIKPLKQAYPDLGQQLPDEYSDQMESLIVEEMPKAEFSDIKDLRKEYNDRSKDYEKQTAAYGRLIDSAFTKDGQVKLDGPSQMALIFNYMKVLDPGSTVREGEYKTAADARPLMAAIQADAEQRGVPVPSKVMGLLQQMETGGQLLDRDVRNVANAASDMYKGAVALQDERDKFYSNEASLMDIDPDRVIGGRGRRDVPIEWLSIQDTVTLKPLEEYSVEDLKELTPEQRKKLAAQ